METFIQDLRYGIRMMLKSPGFTAVAVLALALGIGANSAIFSVVNAVLLRPLPYQDPDELVILWEKAQQMDMSVAYLNFIDWHEQNQSFDSIAAFRRHSFNLTGAGEPERLQGRMVSAKFFSTLGIRPMMGRDFLDEEDRSGGNAVVILDHGFWQRRFGGDPSIIGSQITLNNESFTVIAIAPPSFEFGAGSDLYVPLGHWADLYQDRGNHPGLWVVARLKAGVTQEQARADMDAIMGRLGEQYPDTNTGRRVHIASLYEDTVSDIRPPLLVLLGAVGFVLLIACANVANLLLARSAVRQKEIAIRAALGASRLRVVRQLLTESVLLGLMGGALGLLIALWGTDFLIGMVPDSIPRLEQANVDLRVLGFTFLVSALTGIIFGLAPALQSSRLALTETLKEGDRGSTGGRHRVRNVLVVAEVALALVLLIGAGLMIKSLLRLQGIESGVNSENLLTMELSFAAVEGEGQKVGDFFNRLHQNISGLPGVESVTYSNGLPFVGAMENSFLVDGRPRPEPGEGPLGVQYFVSPDYFQTLGIRLLRGRYFSETDNINSPMAVIIDEELARIYFPGEDPIGKRLTHDAPDVPKMEIVGIVSHVEHYGLDGAAPVQAQFYVPFDQIPEQFLHLLSGRMNLAVRTSSDPANMADAIRGQVLATDPNQPVFNVRTMEWLVDQSIAPRRFSMLLLAIFAVVALALAAVGIYGVMSYSVTQRTHEIGIRMALGAERRDILKLVVGQGMVLAFAGVGIGLIAAFGLTRVLSSLLYGVSATDPLTFGGISLLLTGVALVAIYIPAHRAIRVDPCEALRYE